MVKPKAEDEQRGVEEFSTPEAVKVADVFTCDQLKTPAFRLLPPALIRRGPHVAEPCVQSLRAGSK